ncbi:MAG: hypothetical protein CMG08_00765 [Candidatus Marinimicrobia bacterium]|nr:hypothetical protein [Candidatus Neomarinimicrobiota bacterium]
MNKSRRRFIYNISSIIGGSFLFNDVAYPRSFSNSNSNSNNTLDSKELLQSYMIPGGTSYLNHASIGTIPRAVHNAHVKYLEICETNPSLYVWGLPWKEIANNTRRIASNMLGCHQDDLAITHNTTEGFNILAHGLDLKPSDEVLFSSLNHAGASMPWKGISKIKKFQVRSFDFPINSVFEMNQDDIVDNYLSQIRGNTRALIFPHIDNIIGLRHPIQKIASGAKKLGVEYIFIDGAQSAGMISVDLNNLGVDAFSMSPHKWIQAPKGTGLFYVHKDLRKKLPKMWYKSSVYGKDNSAIKYEDYSTRAWPAVVALGDAIRFQNAIGEVRKINYYRSLWNKTKDLVESNPQLTWHSPKKWELSSAIMSIEVRNKSSLQLEKSLSRDHNFFVRPFAKPINALRVSPNMFSSIKEIETLFDLVINKIDT